MFYCEQRCLDFLLKRFYYRHVARYSLLPSFIKHIICQALFWQASALAVRQRIPAYELTLSIGRTVRSCIHAFINSCLHPLHILEAAPALQECPSQTVEEGWYQLFTVVNVGPTLQQRL